MLKFLPTINRPSRNDALAGLTGAVAGGPQAMGFALIAGVSPLYGLYATIVATIIGAFTSGSSFMTIAPTNALALVVGSTLIGFDEVGQIERLFLITILVGVIQLAFGLLRFGRLTRFFSDAVMTGFITGAGVLIILGQLRHMNGVTLNSAGGNPVQRFMEWIGQIPKTDGNTLMIGIVTIGTILILKRTRLKNAAILAGIALATMLTLLLNWQNVAIVLDTSPIPSGLPLPMMVNFEHTESLLPAALAMAILALVQSAALTQSVPEKDGSIPDVNQDFLGQGVANVVGGFFQGMPSGGSLSRTAVNINAGAQTRWANAFAGMFIGLFLILLGPIIELVPLAALAGQLIVAAVSLFRPRELRMVMKINPSARWSMIITFASTLILPLEYSIYIGVALSLSLFLYSSSQRVKAVRLIPLEPHQFRTEALKKQLPSGEPVIISVSGHLYFAAMKQLEDLLPEPDGTSQTIVILRLRDNDYLGSTGIHFLQRYIAKLEAGGGKLMLSGISPKIQRQLEQSGFLERIGRDNIFYESDIIFSSTERALTYAQVWLQEKEQGIVSLE